MRKNEITAAQAAMLARDVRDIHLRAIYLRDLLDVLDDLEAHDSKHRAGLAAAAFCGARLAAELVDNLGDVIEALS